MISRSKKIEIFASQVREKNHNTRSQAHSELSKISGFKEKKKIERRMYFRRKSINEFIHWVSPLSSSMVTTKRPKRYVD